MQGKRANIKKNNLIAGSVVAVIISCLPYLFYFYEAVPEDGWDIGWVNTVSAKYDGPLVAFWIIMNKVAPVALLLIWFFTCKHWWYHVILIPLSMYVFQLYSTIAPDVEVIDKNELFFVVPVVIISLSLTYLARIKVFDKIHGIDISEIEQGIKKPSDRWFT